jgi:hypothetical protein
MSGLLDSAPGMLATVASAVGTVIWFVGTAVRRYRALDIARKQSAIPPSPQIQSPGPAVDAAVLARLRSLEEHDVLTTALTRSEHRVDDLEQQVQELRREIERLTVKCNAERAISELRLSLLRAKNEHVARLQEDLARERSRRRGIAIEVAAEHEHRDASQAGQLQDAIRTPLRPPAR